MGAITSAVIMDAITSVVIDGTKTLIKFTCSRIKTISEYEDNIRDLRKEIVNLTSKKMEIEEDVTLAKLEGKEPKLQVKEYLKNVSKVEKDVMPLLAMADEYADGWGSSIMHQYQHCCRVAKQLDLVKGLNSIHFETVAPETWSPIKAVEEMAVPSLVGQRAKSDLKKLLEILNRNDIIKIAVWGKGGIGKTTLVKNLNNELYFSHPHTFAIIIWVQASRRLNLSNIQSQIAKRIHLKPEPRDTPHSLSNRILRRLKKMKILLILDDVWEKVDLDAVGIPSRDPCCKILLTTRSFDVCRHMAVDESFELNTMCEVDAWDLFVHSAGPVLNLDGIESPARKIVAGLRGLPLAIKTLGKSMRDRPQMEVWRNACLTWHCSSPLFKNIENEVFGTMATSYHFLPSKILKQCFLFCSMYPASFSIDVHELILCWLSDGLINENQSIKDALNYGIALVEHLKDSCLLDQDSEGTVKMHDMFRELALLLLSKSEELYGFHCQPGHPFYQMPQESSRRVSFTRCRIKDLPELSKYSQLTVLFLQGNPIQNIPDDFFQNLNSLRVLNLSETHITSLPSSFLCLHELRSLFLRSCPLKKLPSFETLSKLLVLDVSSTKITELSKGFRSLRSLRELNLSNTEYLKKIVAGSISGLSSLETLDVSFSAYNWNPKIGTYKRSTFDELLSLDHLSVLKIRLDSVEDLASASSWIKKLRKFDIQVSPRNCGSNHHVAKGNEKQLVLRGVNFVQEDLQDLLRTASSLKLLTCIGMTQKHWLCLSSLKSLTISNCNNITCLISDEGSSLELFPSLQNLVLDHLENLDTISQLLSRGKCLGNLKTIQVLDCPKLKGTISYAMLRRVQKLEEIKVSGCKNMSYIIKSGEHGETLPNLRVIEIRNMNNLSMICNKKTAFPALQRIEVSDCSELKKLPLEISNLSRLKEIRGDLKWWNSLQWDDGVKNIFLQHFQPNPVESCSRKRKYK
ncbi:NB-ARC domain-containing disease resistance protein [Artemisia annua]|uniref:NB-ARC domain-containing disease resistance protein n=1 Tax=Artemisia annua TaxID=35608 RepID=A0A2U1NDC3_ARTAN|nr:NB-ARC domain-containing disease resistance protein [Artemisia annua]